MKREDTARNDDIDMWERHLLRDLPINPEEARELCRLARLALEAGDVLRPFADKWSPSDEDILTGPKGEDDCGRMDYPLYPFSARQIRTAAAFLARLEGTSDG